MAWREQGRAFDQSGKSSRWRQWRLLIFFLNLFFKQLLCLSAFSCASVSLTVCLCLFLPPPLSPSACVCLSVSLPFSPSVCVSVNLSSCLFFNCALSPFFPLPPSTVSFSSPMSLCLSLFDSVLITLSLFSWAPPWWNRADNSGYLTFPIIYMRSNMCPLSFGCLTLASSAITQDLYHFKKKKKKRFWKKIFWLNIA